jgi:hypothetical protein
LYILQGDGDYELVKDIKFDDYLLKRITKVCPFLILLRTACKAIRNVLPDWSNK